MSAYSLWVMEFAAVPNYPQSGLIYGMHNQGTRKLPYCYIVIKGQGQLAMVDVGYNHKAHGEVLANTYGVRGWHPPREVLGEIGIRPEDISNIFITHAHFDHMGNIEDFPNATFYLQERELSKWVWTMSLERRFRWLMLGIDPADIMRAVDLARQGPAGCGGWRSRKRAARRGSARRVRHAHLGIDVRDGAQRSGGEFAKQLGVLRRPGLWIRKPARPRSQRSRVHSDRVSRPAASSIVMMTAEAMVKSVGGDVHRVIPPHEERLKDLYPSRITKAGLRITELALADGEKSQVE